MAMVMSELYPLPLQQASPSAADEVQLIQSAMAGDLDAFNGLVLKYQSQAYNVAYQILFDEDAAQDIAQTAFLTAYRKLHTFRGKSFRSWLLRMVTNASIDELRRRKRHPSLSLEPSGDDEDIGDDGYSWIADPSFSPEQMLERKEMEQILLRSLQKISEDYRVVLILADIEGLDYLEIASVMDLPLGTVKSRLARARAKMRHILDALV